MQLIEPNTECNNCADSFLGLHYFYEAIIGRDGRTIGIKISVRFSDGCAKTPRRRYYSRRQLLLWKSIAFRAKLMVAGLPNVKIDGAYAPSKNIFIYAEQSSLLKEDAQREVERLVSLLEKQSSKLVLIVDATQVGSGRLTPALIKTMLAIKELGAEFALRCSEGLQVEDSLLHLDIYSYVFIDMGTFNFPLRTKSDEAEYENLYEKMCTVIQHRNVKFIANNVKSYERAVAAYAMPFSCFEASRYVEDIRELEGKKASTMFP